MGVVKETDALQSQILVLLYIFSAESYHSQCSFSVLCLIKRDRRSQLAHLPFLLCCIRTLRARVK